VFADADLVVHTAAMTHPLVCEANAFEAVKTNVLGTQNVVEAAIAAGVAKVVALSSDRAVDPTGVCGTTQLAAEQLVIQANATPAGTATRFAVVRLPSGVNGRGGLLERFARERDSGRVTIPAGALTRFWLTIDDAVAFALRCEHELHGGEIFVPRTPSVEVRALAEMVAPGCAVAPDGEAADAHETLVSAHESRRAVTAGDVVVIKPRHAWWDEHNWGSAPPLRPGRPLSSDENDRWMTERAPLLAAA
jgi:UDP-N-acetylglucosamine 4,6-dehydratase